MNIRLLTFLAAMTVACVGCSSAPTGKDLVANFNAHRRLYDQAAKIVFDTPQAQDVRFDKAGQVTRPSPLDIPLERMAVLRALHNQAGVSIIARGRPREVVFSVYSDGLSVSGFDTGLLYREDEHEMHIVPSLDDFRKPERGYYMAEQRLDGHWFSYVEGS